MEYLDSLFDLKDKVVIVTGATGQLGQVICKAFTQAGSAVVGLDLNIDNQLEGVEYYILDITKKEDVDKVFSKIADKHNRVDILINNAGGNTFEPFMERSEENFDWVMDVNLKGTFFCTRSFVNQYDASKSSSGSIINIASIFGVVSPDFRNYTDCDRTCSEIYCSTKAGIIQMTKYFAINLADRGIRVNTVSPGGIFNPKSPQGEDFIKNYSFRVPMKRMAEETEMIGAILYMAGNAASYTTGQNLVVDGGMTSW